MQMPNDAIPSYQPCPFIDCCKMHNDFCPAPDNLLSWEFDCAMYRSFAKAKQELDPSSEKEDKNALV